MSNKEKRECESILRGSLKSRNPKRVAAAVNLPPIHPNVKTVSTCPNMKATLIDEKNDIKTDWSSFLTSLNEARYYAKQGDIGKCFDAQSALHSNLNHIFSMSSGNWLLPALHTVCVNTHRTAVLADSALGLGRNDHTRLENAVNLLQESFSKTLNDRKPFEVRYLFFFKFHFLLLLNEFYCLPYMFYVSIQF